MPNDKPKTSAAQRKAHDTYIAKNKLVEVRFRVSADRKAEIDRYAAERGESVNKLMERLVDQEIPTQIQKSDPVAD